MKYLANYLAVCLGQSEVMAKWM